MRILHGLGNEVRLRFLDLLRIFHDGNLCYELGYSGFAQYCDRELGLARSTSLEYIRVAEAFDGLPTLRALFGHGELSWEQVRAISRVATAQTEAAWIGLALDDTVHALLAEVREARRTGRDSPRDRRHGLPNLLVRVTLNLTLEEKERVRAAFEMVSAEPGPDLGGGPGDANGRDRGGSTDPRSPLVRWADGILAGAIPAHPLPSGTQCPRSGGASPSERPSPAQTILYRMCPACRQATLETRDARVSVTPERIAELAPVSNSVTIAAEEEMECEVLPPGCVDEPNSPRLARQVLHRDGLRCANPGCGRRGTLHAHHIVHRSRGGRTRLSNEVTVCDTCHALIHKGLLEVTGTVDSGLVWRRNPLSPNARLRDVEDIRARLRDMVVSGEEARVTGPAHVDFPTACRPGRSPTPPPADARQRLEDLSAALVRLGFSRSESDERIAQATADLLSARPTGPGDVVYWPDEGAILERALRGRSRTGCR